MRLIEHLRGRRLTLASPLPPHVIERQIKRAIVSAMWSFKSGVTGRAGGGRLRLRYHRPFWQYGGQPVLSGRIVEANHGSRLELTFRPPLAVLAFFGLWYAFWIFFAISLPVSDRWTPATGEVWLFVGIVAVMMLFPPAMHFGATFRAEVELERILDFIEQRAKARVVG